MLVLGAGAGAAQAAPTWSVDDAVVSEGNSGTTQVTFTLTADGITTKFLPRCAHEKAAACSFACAL